MGGAKEPPATYFCSLTHQLMKEPVIDPEGNTYERAAIEEWIARSGTSPITRTPLTSAEIVPNRALQDAIQEYIAANGEPSRVLTEGSEMPWPLSSANPSEESKLSVGIDIHSTGGKEALAMVTVAPPTQPSGVARTPVDVCCVVDVSGSMSTTASIKDKSGKTEDYGLTVLDIVKHALRTIVATLSPADRMSIVAYSSCAKRVIPLTVMNKPGKKRAEAAIEGLNTGGSTNLWDGLLNGMEELRESAREGRQASIMLLTDGLPNVEPPRGHMPTLRRYLDQAPEFDVTVNTFGFGYSLDSDLLVSIAQETGGTFSFVPDGSFVGTAFVNATSNMITAASGKATLLVEGLNGAKVEENTPGLPECHVTPTSWGSQINIGTVHYGQPRHLVVRLTNVEAENVPIISATLKYKSRQGKAEAVSSPENAGIVASEKEPGVQVNYLRLLMADAIRSAVNHASTDEYAKAKAVIKDLLQKMTDFRQDSKHEHVKDMITDLSGQVTEALSKSEWFKKWGVHYLPSLAHAHMSEKCLNFKDPGIQHYGGALFNEQRDKADDIFVRLPPPKPSGKSTGSSRIITSSMSAFHNHNNPCFHGSNRVLLANGELRRCDQVRKGEAVMNGKGSVSLIECVVKTMCHGRVQKLVRMPSGLLVTAWHPIYWNGEWEFPCNLFVETEVECEAVYSFILADRSASMVIEGVEVVTLAHGLTSGDIREHEYYGTEKIVDDLAKMCGWDHGLVTLLPGCAVRDPITRLVTRIKSQEEMMKEMSHNDCRRALASVSSEFSCSRSRTVSA